jgi:hypothetical protein
LIQKIPAVLAGAYGVLVLLSVVPVLFGTGSLAGIFLVVLGLPWTPLLSRATAMIDPALSDGLAAGLVTGLVGCALNWVIIYSVARWIVRTLQSP